MTQIDDIVLNSGKITLGVVLRTGWYVLIGSVIALVFWVMLLPLFRSCGLEGEAAVKCVILFLGILFLALGVPLLLFWFGKNYALRKAFFSLYEVYKKPVLMMCAEKACTHRESIIQAQKFKHGKFFKELPLIMRLVLGRIDLSFLTQTLKNNPAITPAILKIEIEEKIEKSGLISKPRPVFFWTILGMIILIFFGLKIFI